MLSAPLKAVDPVVKIEPAVVEEKNESPPPPPPVEEIVICPSEAEVIVTFVPATRKDRPSVRLVCEPEMPFENHPEPVT